MNTYLSLGNSGGVLIASICGILLGVILLLAERRLRGRMGFAAALVILVVLLGVSSAAALLHQPANVWLPLACLACCWGVGLLLRTAAPILLIRGLVQLLGNHRLQALALVLLGFSSILAWSNWEEKQLTAIENESEVWDWKGAAECSKAPFQFVTDRGRPVGTFVAANPAEAALSIEAENRYLHQNNFSARVIRTAKADLSSNCHGWVYAGGRFWISGDDVEAILEDNGYTEVTAPQANDLVICRGVENSALHSGVVRMVKEDGSVLVESKWGKKGTFLHAPEDQLYAKKIHYYRTARGTHLLRGPDGKPYSPHDPRPAYPESRTTGRNPLEF